MNRNELADEIEAILHERSEEYAVRCCMTIGRGDVRLLREAAAALREPADGWLPIESAPKGGTVVDLWCGTYEERLIGYCRVDLKKGNVFYAAVGAGRSCVRTATHWRPQPPPPKAAPSENSHERS